MQPAARTRADRFLSRTAWALLVLTGVHSVGCQQMMASMAAMWGRESTRKVPAEYTRLEGQRICIVVWAEMDTLFEYPHVQYEISEHVRAAIDGRVKGASFVPSRDVVDFQRQNADWDRMDPAEIGRRFAAERVLSIELTRYTTREPDSPHLYRGRISANVSITDPSGGASARLKDVETVHPPDAPAAYGVDDAAVRLATMAEFGRAVGQKFYEHDEPK
jgi:hypothetical protein